MTIDPIHPGILFLIGAVILPLLKVRILKQILILIIPLFAFTMLLNMHEGVYWTFNFLNYELIPGRIDSLSMVFGYVFVIIAFFNMIYALHIKEYGQHIAALTYIGGALGVTFAGDFFTLFVSWELMAVSSVFLILYGRNKKALNAGIRYLVVHVIGGCVLLGGIIIQIINTNSITFDKMDFNGIGPILMLIGFILNAAVPPLNAWLPDAYPEGSVTGSVFLTAFTTKSAVYVLARAFPGVELLMWLGAIMAVYGIIFAVIENNIRRLLAYHIISQVGYMVCGVGIGTEMAINGSSAHAFCHILYKALLFMAAGAVLHITGKSKITDLEGNNLFKKMPITLLFYMIAALSISGAPLFNGFISKSMVVSAAGEAHQPVVELLLHWASVGTFLSVGLKLPWGTWFGKKEKPGKEIDAKEPPLNMLLAMGITAFSCILTGIFPKILYDILPYPVTFHPYTGYHVIGTLQLMLLTGLGFWLLINKLHVSEKISIDTDWFYRKGTVLLMKFNYKLNDIREVIQKNVSDILGRLIIVSHNPVYYARSIANKSEEKYEYFDSDIYRKPLGVGVFTVLLIFSLVLFLMLFVV